MDDDCTEVHCVGVYNESYLIQRNVFAVEVSIDPDSKSCWVLLISRSV